jgi:hypothetical protein
MKAEGRPSPLLPTCSPAWFEFLQERPVRRMCHAPGSSPITMVHCAAGNPTRAYRVATEGIQLRTIVLDPVRARQGACVDGGRPGFSPRKRTNQMVGRRQLWEARRHSNAPVCPIKSASSIAASVSKKK